MAPVNRGWVGTAIDRLFAWMNKLPPESCSYTVERLHIPLADDVRLAADLYQPASPKPPLGTLLIRSPYGIGMPNSLSLARIFAARGYKVLFSSCRGSADSGGGGIDPGRYEAADGLATVAWMRKQPWYTGSFATLGGSYMGYTQWALLSDNPPADMKTAIIKTGPHDFGAFTCGTGAMSSDMITWADITAKMAAGAGPISMLWYMRSQKERIRPVFDAVPLLDAVETYLSGGTPEWLRYTITHPEQTDPFWKPLQQHGALERANIPILLVTGWHDLLMPQVMEQYSKLAERGCNVAFTIGPWSHLGAQRTTLAETFDWLDKHVADRQDARTAPVRVFVTGAEEWRDLAKWPPATSAYELCLAADKSLSATAPPADAPQSTFTFDPADPTPAVGVPQLFDTGGKREPDTSLATRSDVLTFITEPLDQDVEVCGKPSVSLHHSSDSPHVDLLVLLSEVDSTGASYSISEKYMRLDPSRDQGPGTALGLNLHDCAHRFRKGNRIRLLIAGGSHPRYIRNLGTGDNPGTGSTMRPVSHTIRHDASAVSKLVLPVCRKE